jgi:hypothetical protein
MFAMQLRHLLGFHVFDHSWNRDCHPRLQIAPWKDFSGYWMALTMIGISRTLSLFHPPKQMARNRSELSSMLKWSDSHWPIQRKGRLIDVHRIYLTVLIQSIKSRWWRVETMRYRSCKCQCARSWIDSLNLGLKLNVKFRISAKFQARHLISSIFTRHSRPAVTSPEGISKGIRELLIYGMENSVIHRSLSDSFKIYW